MLKPLLITLAFIVSLVFVTVAPAADKDIVGVVTTVEAGAIQVRTDRTETTSVALTPDTKYLKWIMAKPWQQDIRADVRMLRPGSRVHIEVAPGTGPGAKTVWIVVGRPGGVN